MLPSPKWAARVAYLGTSYAGWQWQNNVVSVQEKIEDALSFVANEEIKTVCAGRTDAGVHATGQVVHFESNAERTASNWLLGANTKLPSNIRILEVIEVKDDFSARFSAIARTYHYVIYNTPQMSPIWCQHAAHVKGPLDLDAINEAAQHLLGEHDFTSFRAAGCQAKHAVREIISLSATKEHNFITIKIKANAFLYHMVRITVGALLKVGKKQENPIWVKRMLDQKQRAREVIMMPSHGLYLVEVDYPEEAGVVWSSAVSHHMPGDIPG